MWRINRLKQTNAPTFLAVLVLMDPVASGRSSRDVAVEADAEAAVWSREGWWGGHCSRCGYCGCGYCCCCCRAAAVAVMGCRW